MVYYIRFLQPPRWKSDKTRRTPFLSSLLTLTTDLGDDFYPGEVTIRATLVSETNPHAVEEVKWKPGCRCVRVNMEVNASRCSWPASLAFAVNDLPLVNHLGHQDIPEFVNAWTAPFTLDDDPDPRMVRRFTLPTGDVLNIYEENGDSIARHIWWAMAHLPFLHDFYSHHHLRLAPGRTHQILELGSGCGTVGIGVAQSNAHCSVWVTDHPDAMETLSHNVMHSSPMPCSKLNMEPLDWNCSDAELLTLLDSIGGSVDLIIVSECIYNPDSIPALVNTIQRIVDNNTTGRLPKEIPSIYMATKVRHPSEAVFFDLMAEAGFNITERVTTNLPDTLRKANGLPLEKVDIYSFVRNHEAVRELKSVKKLK
ncbi:MAG: hypothetical protein Q9167_001243 [Letrouitia subvulpina]